ncbi:hypothetical protein AB0M22_02025 [Nocardia sp. NPDC051756]|uniref:hypothetical protein n=1 Tax=Nocardia sp. NPDC051756 TaxID=3154751 RepID=UPI00342E12B8
MIGKIGAAAAAGLTATLLLAGGAGANTFQTDQSIGGFTAVSKQDPEKCKEDGKKKTDPAPGGAAPSDPGAAGSDQSGSEPSGAEPQSNPPAPEPAAGILPSTGSATGKTTREPGDQTEQTAPQKKECKTDGADKGKGADKSKGAETEPSGGAEAAPPSAGGETEPPAGQAPAAPTARTTH